ncbi:MAG: hypothetical protein WD605_01160, partial [Candidatus Paceibacterota bacterium]
MDKLTAKRSYDRIGVGVKSLLLDPAIFTSLLLVLVAVSSFGLGRQSVSEKLTPLSEAEAVNQNNPETVAKSPEVITRDASHPRYVASKNSQVFHLLTCPGAKQISEANKIYFNTKEEAVGGGGGGGGGG